MRSINCFCSIDNDMDCEVLEEEQEWISIRTRHKDIRCCECLKIIPARTEHEYFFGRWNGEYGGYRTCLDCVSVRDAILCNWVFHNVWEMIDEGINAFYNEPSEDCYLSMTPAGRAKVMEKIEDQWQDEDECCQDYIEEGIYKAHFHKEYMDRFPEYEKELIDMMPTHALSNLYDSGKVTDNQLKEYINRLRDHISTCDTTLHNSLVVMKAAYISGQNNNHEACMKWLHNYLWALGLLPTEKELEMGAQVFFDKNIINIEDDK